VRVELSQLRSDEFIINYIETLTSEKRKRFNSALTDSYKAFPTSKQSYRVYSYPQSDAASDDNTRAYHIIYPRTDPPNCGCRDFFYRGQNSNRKCKHLWRVWLEMYVGLIPTETEEPYEWLLESVESELFSVIDSDIDETKKRKQSSQLKALRKYINEHNRATIDYEKAYTSWAKYWVNFDFMKNK
jgi:hypothetical protein